MAQMAQQLNQANFAQAQQAGLADVSAQNQVGLANQQNQQANLGRQNTDLLANQSANAADLQRQLAAQTSNQSAALQQGALANQASAGLGSLGNQQMQNNIANYGMLTSAGGFEQQQAQNQINAQLAKFNQAFQYPQQQLGMMESSLGMTPYDTGTSGTSQSTTTQTQSNPMSMALGGLQTLGGLFGSGGPMAGMLGASDRSMKTDITRLGKDPKTGLDMHAYRYKGDPKTYPKVVGPMAQDVEAMYPGSTERVGKKGKLAIRGYAGGTSFVAPNMDDVDLGSQLMDPSGASMFAPPQAAARPQQQQPLPTEAQLPAPPPLPTVQPGMAHIYRPQGYAMGTPHVPGRGRGDTVPAMLTPGEAVLRPHVAQAIGRGNIAMMNAMPPSSPGVGKVIGALGKRQGPLQPGVATPPSRGIVSMRAAPRMPILGALGGG